MKVRTIFLMLAFCFSVVAASFADDANVGSWKLNDSKSKIPAGAQKNNTVVYTAEGDSYKCVVDGVDGAGQPAHNEWTGKFDGKDYPVTGDPNADARAIQKVDDHHYIVTNKKDGKPTLTGKIALSADGKTRTLTSHGKGAKGKTITSVAVYDKQ